MSPPRAYVVHRSRGRLRLRVPERKNDAAYFERLADALRAMTGVRQVSTNPSTASVLVEHFRTPADGDGAALLERAGSRGHFLLHEGAPPRQTPLASVAGAMSELGSSLTARTEGRWDLASLGFYVLIGGGLYQLVKGRFMPAGGALFLAALNLVGRQAERQQAAY